MWIEIHKDIFENHDFRGLNYLIQLLTWIPNGSIQRYNLYVEYSRIKASKMYDQLHAIDKELLVMEFEKYITQSSTHHNLIKYSITDAPAQSNHFKIEEAIRFFSQPISIILENSKNDAFFIKAIIRHFDKDSLTEEHLANGWIQFENAGGCTNVQNFIEGKLQSYNNLAAQNGKNVEDYFRGILLLDSDKEYPAQKQKAQYKMLKSYLNSKKIAYHFLEKRMMENYMPDEVYETITDRTLQRWIQVYKHLSDEQKDFLNITNGFPKEFDEHKIRKPIKTELLDLFKNLSKTNFDIVDEGFKYKDFKNEFPKFFMEHHSVYKESLKKRAHSDELERILQKIKDLL